MTNCNIVNPKYHLIGEGGMNNNLLHKQTEKVGRYINLWQKSLVFVVVDDVVAALVVVVVVAADKASS